MGYSSIINYIYVLIVVVVGAVEKWITPVFWVTDLNCGEEIS